VPTPFLEGIMTTQAKQAAAPEITRTYGPDLRERLMGWAAVLTDLALLGDGILCRKLLGLLAREVLEDVGRFADEHGMPETRKQVVELAQECDPDGSGANPGGLDEAGTVAAVADASRVAGLLYQAAPRWGNAFAERAAYVAWEELAPPKPS
jgi:hypothetical protein